MSAKEKEGGGETGQGNRRDLSWEGTTVNSGLRGANAAREGKGEHYMPNRAHRQRISFEVGGGKREKGECLKKSVTEISRREGELAEVKKGEEKRGVTVTRIRKERIQAGGIGG